MFAMFIAMLIGTGIAFQTAINARLRQRLQSPFLTSFVSFLLGTLTLAVILWVKGEPVTAEAAIFNHTPWWVWTGGLLAMFGLTVNILIFPRLGSVQTALMPLLGQVSTGILIDTFGWLHSPHYAFTLPRFGGLLLVMIGVGTVILLPALHQKPRSQQDGKSLLVWQLLGILGGVAAGITPAVNSTLGQILQSATQSALVPLLTSTLALTVIITLKEPKSWLALHPARVHGTPLPHWFGGFLGAAYVFGVILLVPLIGTGSIIIASLFGLLGGSLLIDHFGWLGTHRNPVTLTKISGLLLLLAGIVLIQLNK